jgi:hypothetical protein
MTLFFLLTFGLLLGLAFVFAGADRQDVMANWDKKRCLFPVALAANFYQPADDKRSGIEFAKENFQFCTENLIRDIFTLSLNPFLALFKDQLAAAGTINDVFNGVRDMLGNFFRSFSDILGGIFNRFMMVGFELRRIYIEFQTAMERAFAIALSSAFMGISMIVGIDNAVQFVVKVVLIIIGILAGLMIILFFILAPFLPVIITTISVLVAAGVGGAGAFSGTFCFAPSTILRKKDGSSCPIGEICLGDILENGAIVEGILETNGSESDLYRLGRIRVSGDHLVYYEQLDKWISVKDHPNAIPEVKREQRLYCLNTSARKIVAGGYIFRDWEELPEDPYRIAQWNQKVAEILKSKTNFTTNEYCILSGAWKVKTQEGSKALRDIELGDLVESSKGWSKVIGKYVGKETIGNSADPFWFSDSVWWRGGTEWRQIPNGQKGPILKGFHLITDSGTFLVNNGTESREVRDFTEVGSDRIAETYEWMKAIL